MNENKIWEQGRAKGRIEERKKVIGVLEEFKSFQKGVVKKALVSACISFVKDYGKPYKFDKYSVFIGKTINHEKHMHIKESRLEAK